jgi:tRNA pseudouridine55 synthase
VPPPADTSPPDGLVLVDKPAGRTSFSVTNEVRRGLGIKKAGHAGTLDPFATGLLCILVGRARRAQRFLTLLEKEYVTVARLGALSTTGDPEGEITETGRIPPPGVALPTGRLTQVPPAYSAVRVAGRKAYELARAGVEFEVPSREVVVHAFEERWREGERAEYLIRCSSGTYVRSLITELGDAYCVELRRTRVGPWSVEEADPQRVLPLADALAFLPRVEVGDDAGRRVGWGQTVAAEVPADAEHVLVVDPVGVVGIARPLEGGLLRPVVGFRG